MYPQCYTACMWKYHVFWVIALVLALGCSKADAAVNNVAEQQRQILFEAMLYDGGGGPSLQDKKPASAHDEVSQVTPVQTAPQPVPAPAPAPQVSYQDHGQQPNAPITPVAVQPAAAPTVTPLLPPGPLTRRQTQVVQPVPIAQSVPVAPAVAQASPVAPPRPAASSTSSASSPQSELYRRAMSGDVEAEYQMGMINAQDRVGMPSTTGQSHYWFTQAASKGHPKAQYNLGVMYAQGDGVVQNLIEAYIWFNLASAQRMDGASQARDMVASSLTPDALMKAQERSSFYQQKITQNVVRIQNEGPQAFVPVQ